MTLTREIRDIMSRISKIESQVSKIPTRIGSSGGGGGGTGQTIWYEAESKGELPAASTVPRTALGRVTSGYQEGMVCVINPDGDGWDAINFFE